MVWGVYINTIKRHVLLMLLNNCVVLILYFYQVSGDDPVETESDTDSDSCTREKYKGGDENSSNSESESEVWSGVLLEMLSRDRKYTTVARSAAPQNSPSKSKFAGVLAPLFSPTLASDVPFK